MLKPLLRYPHNIALILFELKLFQSHVLLLVEDAKHVDITRLHVTVSEYPHLYVFIGSLNDLLGHAEINLPLTLFRLASYIQVIPV